LVAPVPSCARNRGHRETGYAPARTAHQSYRGRLSGAQARRNQTNLRNRVVEQNFIINGSAREMDKQPVAKRRWSRQRRESPYLRAQQHHHVSSKGTEPDATRPSARVRLGAHGALSSGPTLPLILMSGHPDLAEADEPPEGSRVFLKPMRVRELLEIVEAALLVHPS
jgi:hypothetical protein